MTHFFVVLLRGFNVHGRTKNDKKDKKKRYAKAISYLEKESPFIEVNVIVSALPLLPKRIWDIWEIWDMFAKRIQDGVVMEWDRIRRILGLFRKKIHLLLAFFIFLPSIWLAGKDCHYIWIRVVPHLWVSKTKLWVSNMTLRQNRMNINTTPF